MEKQKANINSQDVSEEEERGGRVLSLSGIEAFVKPQQRK